MFEVTVMCEVLEVSRSPVHEWRSRPPTPARGGERLGMAFSGPTRTRTTRGAPRITVELRLTHGWPVGGKREARLMHERCVAGFPGGAACPARRPGPPPAGTARPGRAVFTGYAVDRPWMADLRYVPTWQESLISPCCLTQPPGAGGLLHGG